MCIRDRVQSVSCLQCILPRFANLWQYDLDLWPSTQIPQGNFYDGDQSYQVVWSWSLRFILYPAYNVLLLCDKMTLTFDLRPEKTIGIFLSSCWLNIPSCKILELANRSTRPGQTDRQTDRWTTLYHNMVKDGRIKFKVLEGYQQQPKDVEAIRKDMVAKLILVFYCQLRSRKDLVNTIHRVIFLHVQVKK